MLRIELFLLMLMSPVVLMEGFGLVEGRVKNRIGRIDGLGTAKGEGQG